VNSKIFASQVYDKKTSEIKNIRHIMSSQFPLKRLNPVHKIIKFDIDNVPFGCGVTKAAVECEYREVL